MIYAIRMTFPYLAVLVGLSALAWAVSFGTLPPADFTFNNEDEIKTVDPAMATGNPENRIVNALFEGLLRMMPDDTAQPDENGCIPLIPQAGCAELPELAADGTTYTFRIRPNARWSNGDRVTAYDFVWSWRRILHPDTAAEYAYQLYYLRGAKAYNTAEVKPGDRVEVELADRPDPVQLFPRGSIVRGVLKEIIQPPEPNIPADASKEAKAKARSAWTAKWAFVVDVKSVAPASQDGANQTVDWDAPGETRVFSKDPSELKVPGGKTESCRHVLLDFLSSVGARAVDDATLIVELDNPTPFFRELVAFYPYYPVHRPTVEQHGSPNWTKPAHIVGNGPFTLEARRIRDRVRLRKNPQYWDADSVHFNVVDATAVKYQTTALNMFLNGQVDWITKPPTTILNELSSHDYYRAAPALIVYFYRFNVAHKPLDDPRVRRALNMAMDKQAICEHVTRAGERPARNLVPPGLPGYRAALCGEYNVEEARRLLAEAGFPGGRGFPHLQILFNTHDMHRDVAEVIQQQWKTNLGIDIELRNLEWAVYLDSVHKTDFDIARAGWVPDYADPNTYLDMFVTGGGQNNTNWGDPRYDKLIADAGAERDHVKRMAILHEAERLLMDEQPIIPIYFYTTINLVNPRLKNFTLNAQDVHPLHILRFDDSPAGQKQK